MSHASLSTKLVRIGASLLVVALTSIGLTLWITWQLEGSAAAVNEAGRMRMQTWQLTSALQAQMPAAEVAAQVTRLDASLALLRTGDPSRPLSVPWDDEVRHHFASVESQWQAHRQRWLNGEAARDPVALRDVGTFVETIDRLVHSIENQVYKLTAVLNLFQFVMMGLAMGGAVVMLYSGYRFVIHPMAQLRNGLRQIETGDLSARVNVPTTDEFGQVAAGFNRMAATLQPLCERLESQVELKTRRIEAQRVRLEALYEVSGFLASVHTIEELSRGFCERIRTLMKAEAVALRWSDEASHRYLMLAADGLPPDMQDEERSLLAGTCGCGNLQPDARTRVIPIHSHATPRRHCAKAGHKSLVSVPVRLQQRLIGEIDLFFREPVSLREDEVELLDALASHLASALEGLRAAALEREAAVGQERALLARGLHDSIAQALSFLKIQAQLLRSALHKQQPEQVQSTLDELDRGLHESISDVRELLVHFRTRTNTDDIEAALQETLQKFRHQTGMLVRLTVSGEGLPVPADVQVQVLHVLQEALSNVRKHAQASEVVLTVSKGKQWHFTVKDDGAGFDTAQRVDSSHVGISIMRERAERIGAQVTVESAPGLGSGVTLTLPPYPVTHTASGTSS